MQTVTTTPSLPAPQTSSSSSSSPSHSPSFFQHVTFDLIYRLLSRSVFHPFICFLVPLCLLAIHRPASSASVRNSFYWACLVTAYHVLAVWNHRFAYGRARTVALEEEIVLVAGGGGVRGGGLGRLMVETYAMKGVRGVAVLDVVVPEVGPEREEWEDMGVRWYRCDAGKREEVERVKALIMKEFGTHPSILINCIAAPISTQRITSLSTAQFTHTLTTNLVSHFNLLSVFLPPIIASAKATSAKTASSATDQVPKPSSSGGGTIVTVSSILAHLPPANLLPYTASKSGLTTLHHSLVAELRDQALSHVIKPILVEPGLINTHLFADVLNPRLHFTPTSTTTATAGVGGGGPTSTTKTTTPPPPSSTTTTKPKTTLTSLVPFLHRFLGPTLDTTEVCKAITRLVDSGEAGVVRMPVYADWAAAWFAVLPVAVQRVLRWVSGLDEVLVVGGGGGGGDE